MVTGNSILSDAPRQLAPDDIAISEEFVWLRDLEVDEEDRDEICLNCPKWVARHTLDLLPLWLHAMQYKSNEWCFTCPMPDWAEEHWTPHCPG